MVYLCMYRSAQCQHEGLVLVLVLSPFTLFSLYKNLFYKNIDPEKAQILR